MQEKMKKIFRFCLIICECKLILKRSNKEIHKRFSIENCITVHTYLSLKFELTDRQLTEKTLYIEMYLSQQAILENKAFLSVRVALQHTEALSFSIDDS
jgi:hypothetical protein